MNKRHTLHPYGNMLYTHDIAKGQEIMMSDKKVQLNDYLTDFEVFETLTEQTTKDELKENALAAKCMSTELGKKVLQYLDTRPAKLQTREKLEDFLQLQSKLIEDEKISAAQSIQIINEVPVNDVEMKILLDDSDLLDKEERLQLIKAIGQSVVKKK
eukprot:g8476.t1